MRFGLQFIVMVACMTAFLLPANAVRPKQVQPIETVVPAKENKKTVKTEIITGKLIKVDRNTGTIIVRREGRNIQMYGKTKWCGILAEQINKNVKLKYSKNSEGILVVEEVLKGK